MRADVFFELTEMTFVLVLLRRPSNSTSRIDGLAGTAPTTYGRPFNVGACFHCFLLEAENSDGMRLRLEGPRASCCLYSKGTNSSKRISVVDVRGSCVPEIVLRDAGNALYST